MTAVGLQPQTCNTCGLPYVEVVKESGITVYRHQGGCVMMPLSEEVKALTGKRLTITFVADITDVESIVADLVEYGDKRADEYTAADLIEQAVYQEALWAYGAADGMRYALDDDAFHGTPKPTTAQEMVDWLRDYGWDITLTDTPSTD